MTRKKKLGCWTKRLGKVKRMKKKSILGYLCSVALLFFLSIPVSAQDSETSLLEASEETVAEVTTEEEDTSSSLAVGDTFTVNSITYKVTAIGEDPMAEPTTISVAKTTLTVPSTVTYEDVTYRIENIPSGAFYGSGRLTSITLSEGIKTVNASAFNLCYNVTSLSLPSTLQTFTTMGFESLESITLAEGNEYFTLVNGALFTKDGTKLWLYPSGSSATSYTVPSGTTTIVEGSFYYNQNLETITFPDSVTTLEDYALSELQALTDLTFGTNVTSIGDFNLYKCPAIETLTLQNSCALGNYCVYDCPLLETVTINGTMNGYGYFTFWNLPSLTSYQVVSSPFFISIEGVLFGGVHDLLRYPSAKSGSFYAMPNEVEYVAGLAFNYTQNLTEVVISEGAYLELLAFHYPNTNAAMDIYFRDKTSVSMSTSTSGVFVGMTTGSNIYLPTETALSSFSSYSNAINSASGVTVNTGIGVIPTTGMVLSASSLEITYGSSATLSATLTPYYATDSLTWTSSNEEVATVSQAGVITTTGVGECRITLTAGSGVSAYCDVTVNPADVNTLAFSEIASVVYDGSDQTPSVSATYQETTLTEDVDYTVSYVNNINAGSANVIITGIGNYTGKKELSFTILPKDISSVLAEKMNAVIYTGSAITPEVCLKDNEMVLEKTTDYTILYKNNVNAGTATVMVTGYGNYTGSKEFTFEISAKQLSDIDTSQLETDTFTYSGLAISPGSNLTYNKMILEKNKDYKLSYENNINAGTATVTITGCGNYAGTLELAFTILPKDFSKLNIGDVDDVIFTGSPSRPEAVVTDGDIQLQQGTDYQVVYKDNVNVGTATVTITGTGNYTGSKTFTYEILAKELSSIEHNQMDSTFFSYTGSAITPGVILVFREMVLEKNKDYTIAYQNNVNAGTATLILTGYGNYTGTMEISFTILPKHFSELHIGDLDDVTYTGAAFCPEAVVKDGDTVLQLGTDYKVVYKNNVNAGTATATITGIGNYTGSKDIPFYIIPKEITNLEVTLSGGHDDIQVTWKASSGADSYYVYYKKASEKTYQSFQKTEKTSIRIQDLADETTYHFKVVPCFMDGKQEVQGNSSKVVTCSTKKNVVAPNTVKATLSGGYDDVKISWTKSKGASGYYVYYKKSSATSYSKKKVTTKTSITIKNLADGVKYKFKVVPYYQTSGKNVLSYYSKTANVTTLKKVGKPTVKKYSSSKVKVSWKNIDGETGYQISCATTKKGTKIVKTVKGASLKTYKLSAKKGKTCYYKVRAYKTVDGKKIYGPWSKVKAFRL